MIKVITGIRRCGKSFLLFNLFHDYLLSTGVDEAHIIEATLDDRANMELRNPDRMLDYIKSRISDSTTTYYVLLDEVQMMEDFVGVLNSLLHIRNVDAYVTGSNSRFLSKDIVTEFRGRGRDIHLYPLTFKEYYEAVGGDRSLCWRDYSTYGGLPQTLLLTDVKAKRDYLSHLADTVFLADVVERHRIKNRAELGELLCVMASSIGSPCNPTKLSHTFQSLKNKAISNKTVSNYLTYLCDAFLMEKALRYNIKGKKYINTLAKYYFTDVGIRNALLDFRQIEPTHLMENLIFNELLSRGYSVDVGVVETVTTDKSGKSVRRQYEVDFVANDSDHRFYIQSALSIPDEDKWRQETNSFRHIHDSFKRVLIVKEDCISYNNENGVLIIGLYDFLLHPELLR
jgi:predicted AAA+ superfamily ATPase